LSNGKQRGINDFRTGGFRWLASGQGGFPGFPGWILDRNSKIHLESQADQRKPL